MWQGCYATITVVVKLFVTRYWLDRDWSKNHDRRLSM